MQIDTANWMAELRDDYITLNQIMMPGSHDTGMSELHHCNPSIGVGGYTKTQSGSIAQQLSDGSRYFDIRVDYDYEELVTYHRTGPAGCNGQKLEDVLNQVEIFLTSNRMETAILKFSHIRESWGHDPSDTKKRINQLLDNYKSVTYTNPSKPINLAEVMLKDVRGKMILVFDYDEDDYIDPAEGRFRYRDTDDDSIQPEANLTVYDKYSNTSNYDKMKADQLQKWEKYGSLENKYFFLLSWTLTAIPYVSNTIEKLAKEANSKLPDVLRNQIKTDVDKPNIVYIDFLNNEVAKSIIEYNFK